MVFYSEFHHSYYWLPLIGFVIGMLATMVGSGGGSFFPMILILAFQVPAPIAVATSLAASLPLSLVGGLGHYHRGNVHLRAGTVFAIAGIGGAIAGTALTRVMTGDQLRISFGIYSIFLAIIIFFHSLNKNISTQGQRTPIRSTLGAAYGFGGGVISGTFGTSGAIPVLAGLFAMHLPLRLVIGTSIMIIFVNTLSALVGHMLIGRIDLTLVWLLTLGSVLGALTGPHLITGIKTDSYETQVKRIFSVIILILGMLLIINY
jgi:uncharacterized protein